MQTVLLVPGFRENINSRDYKTLIDTIEAKGYTVTFVPINWSRTTVHDWVKEFENIYSRHNPNKTILAGFSYGAMTAFMGATKQNPSELWLFSLSPYFADDIPNIKKSWLENIGHKRADIFRTLDFNALVKNITCKTHIFVGDAEVRKYPPLGARARAAHAHIKNSSLTTVPETGHDVTARSYIRCIEKMIATN